MDGSYDFSQGVDSGRVTTVQSPANPNGLPRTMLAWGNNITVRDGGISPRNGWTQRAIVHDGSALYQGGTLYEPLNGNPYLVFSIGGFQYAVRVDSDNSVVPITTPGLKDGNGSILGNPASQPQAYFCQAEQFLIIQAGDWQTNITGTLPLFYDGNEIVRSQGLPQGQIPAALSMSYYQDRVFYANGRTVSGGDIVGGPSGNWAFGTKNRTDSVLRVTENPLSIGGDGFTVPGQAGNITALNYNAQLDSTLGQGTLYIFTRKQIYGLFVPITRSDWIAAGSNNQPRMVVAQRRFGTVSERSVTEVNGDLFYFSPEPAIRSLIVATRYFQQWGNVAISKNIQRALKNASGFTPANLMGTATGINFDNRMLMGLIPVQTKVGVAFQGIATLDFDLISTLQVQLPPAWEGLLDGFDVLQLFTGDFSGIQRAFAAVHNRQNDQIEVWELGASGGPKTDQLLNTAESRVQWLAETPAYTFGDEKQLKELDGGELWLDNISGTIEVNVQYRADADACWNNWAQVQFCAARSSCETVANPVCYPLQPFCEGQRFPLGLAKPPSQNNNPLNERPNNVGYQFQIRIQITGACRLRAILLYALPRMSAPFYNLVKTNK